MKASSERSVRAKAAPTLAVVPARTAGKTRTVAPPEAIRQAVGKKPPAARASPPKASAAPAPKSTPETKTKVTKANSAAAEAAAKPPMVAKATKPAPVGKAGPALKPAKAENPAPAKMATAKAETARVETAKPAVHVEAKAAPRAEPKKEVKAEPKKEVKADPRLLTKPAGLAEPQAAVEPPAPAPAPAPRPMQPVMQNGRPIMPSRAAAKAEIFVEGDFVVYPTHGVGKVEKIAVEDIAGHRLELIHITFEENRMTLRVPVAKARSAGLRKLATRKMFDEALAVLKGRARIKRTMWSRRAQEYEAKINSGDPLAIAEVVRDLHRNAGQPDQSFSERQIYEAAMDRLAAELAALDQTDKIAASVKLAEFLKTV
jgi:CarD family transcriptional regulator